MNCVTQEERLRHVEDFLHGAQIGRVSEKDIACKGKATLVGMSLGRNDDLTNRVRQVVRVIAWDTVPLRFVPPDDDRAMVPVSLGSHDHRNDLLQEKVALQDLGWI